LAAVSLDSYFFKMAKSTKTFINWLTDKHSVVIRNEDNLAEKATFSFSYGRLIWFSFLIFVILTGCSFALVKTILGKWLNPAYLEEENKNKLLQLHHSLEKLIQENEQQARFIQRFQDVLAHKGEALELPVDKQKKAKHAALEPVIAPNHLPSKTLDNESIEDMVIPDHQIKSKNNAILATIYVGDHDTAAMNDLVLFSPLEGVITTPFNETVEHYGLDIVGKENAPIKSIATGTVLLATWTVETGWVIVLQHNKNLISIYKHNATLFKKAGDLVSNGEVIALMGNSGEFSTGPHLHFEIWCNGTPIDPQEIIAF